MADIDNRALDSLSVAPGDPDEDGGSRKPGQDAGRDKSIAKRLEKNPESVDARLDNALDESMDGSDPASSTQPVHRGSEPAVSSGYDADKEKQLRDGG
ncbi:hypothetical protein [Sphingomonas sp. Leaf343]|uniref:hypothetical protein n=1 Tax=Sphingomonas sp. Leaf343 TaxID=1736345 RepID=UPI0006F3A72C|nr:hypothetical protein [Sphingomonas sp. Leaf343]KQR80871.1 hypothetical protein ASG07_13885 [Sphingomonas sp. Leaf343]